MFFALGPVALAAHERRAQTVSGMDAMEMLPTCTDGSAYGSLLTSHPKEYGGNTYMTRGAVAAGRQVLMLLILLRSLRHHEHVCRRPFVLLLGEHVVLPPADRHVLEAEGHFHTHVMSPVKLGVPPFDKLHAWNLSTVTYRRVLVVDADAMMLGPVEELFAPTRTPPPLTMAHHGCAACAASLCFYTRPQPRYDAMACMPVTGTTRHRRRATCPLPAAAWVAST